MAKIILSVAVVFLAALAAIFLPQSPVYPPLYQQVQGRNNTALFVVNMLSGLHNVHLATIQSLREKHPDIEVHVMSWSPVEAKVARLSENVGAGPVIFHNLTAKDYVHAVFDYTKTGEITDCIQLPGLPGVGKLGFFMQAWMAPWTGPEHVAFMEEVSTVIDKTDPAVVVLDVFMWPAIHAVREKNRLHAFIVPNTPADTFSTTQPWLSALWKYPTFGSSLSFPIAWADIPANIWHAIQVRYALSWTPHLRETKAYLKSHGLQSGGGVDFYAIHRPDTPWITQALAEASLPVDYLPPNVTYAGPLNVHVAPAKEQDAEFTAWLAQAPTVLVNLGNTVSYDRQRAEAFAQALSSVLDENTDLQVLWKFMKAGEYPDEVVKDIVGEHIGSDRLRLVPWLHIDPSAMLETGHITASVHHGGAGSYHEAIS